MILYNYLGNLGRLWEHFGAPWSHFGVTLRSLWPYRRPWEHVMCIVSPCVRPKRAHKQEIHIFPTFFDTFTNHEAPQEAPQGSETEGFWGPSKHILGSFGDFGMTFRALWAYEGYLGIILVDFLKILIFPIDFNDFI